MHKCSADDQAALQHRLHGLLTGAIQAMETAGCTVYDCTEAVPWECTMDMARQVWDTARHVDIFLQLLAHVGGSVGECIVQRQHTYDGLLRQRSLLPLPPGEEKGLVGLAGDGLVQLMELGRKVGDPVIERALDCVVADEITHVRMRSTWLRELPANAPERLRKALELQQSIDA